MTEKRTVKCCPECGSVSYTSARRQRCHHCQKCKAVFKTPALKVTNVQITVKPKFLQQNEPEESQNKNKAFYKTFADDIYQAYITDSDFSYGRYASKLEVTPATIRKSLIYAKKQREALKC